jgi:hypothetical protein
MATSEAVRKRSCVPETTVSICKSQKVTPVQRVHGVVAAGFRAGRRWEGLLVTRVLPNAKGQGGIQYDLAR